MVNISIEIHQLSQKRPPADTPVIVAGGLALMDETGTWFTGMEEPLFEHMLNFTPKWWMKIPEDKG